jgi:disulfide bond formation protein DsbB
LRSGDLVPGFIESTTAPSEAKDPKGFAVMKRGWIWLMAAWGIALGATLGALFIGEVMGMTPCLLCWYQRIFMFPLALILGMAAFADDRRGAIYALPMALCGTAVAGYHTALVAGWVPKWWVPCGAGPSCSQQSLEILGGIQIPWLSLLAFATIAILLFIYLRKTRL